LPPQQSVRYIDLCLLWTLIDLGDSTSRNLGFAHQDYGSVSYGEETITEHNLLEIVRRNPRTVYLKTFTKRTEAKNGAGWEWHIIGRKLTLKMRVQAKRVRQDNSLRIKHRVKSSGQQQRNLLINAAHADCLRPVYCIYCTNDQRARWNHPVPVNGMGPFETGCLLANARDVPEATTCLSAIERMCVPWHYLCIPRVPSQAHTPDESVHATALVPFLTELDDVDVEDGDRLGWDAPSIDDLNGFGREGFDLSGVHETSEGDLESTESGIGYNKQARERESRRLLEREIHRWIVIDVREETLLGYQEDS